MRLPWVDVAFLDAFTAAEKIEVLTRKLEAEEPLCRMSSQWLAKALRETGGNLTKLTRTPGKPSPYPADAWLRWGPDIDERNAAGESLDDILADMRDEILKASRLTDAGKSSLDASTLKNWRNIYREAYRLSHEQ